MNLVEEVCINAVLRPAATAIVDMTRDTRRTMSFGALEVASRRVALALGGAGLQPGDPVLLLQPASLELYATMLGVLRLGMVPLHVSPSAALSFIDDCCELVPPRALIAAPQVQMLKLSSPALRRIPFTFIAGKELCFAHGSGAEVERVAIRQVEDETPALITFEHVGDGMAAPLVTTHGSLFTRELRQNSQALGVDVALEPAAVLANLAAGVTSVLPDMLLEQRPDMSGPVLLQHIRAEGATGVSLPLLVLERLVRFCLAHSISLPQIRQLRNGETPLPPRLLPRLQRVMPNAMPTSSAAAGEVQMLVFPRQGEAAGVVTMAA
ncbi:MAG: AMP-binding protein [Chloroflexaceae bacterium]|jgi:acyl-CoA synthetase (AMP-forming)/AMP-acid ligase II|nr:AMP-binding protein [Chloroflexaceae bacterium]